MCSNLKTMNLSFAGCGFLGIYHIGVACCFKQYAPLMFNNKIAGASAGAIAACSLLCDLPIGEIVSDVLRVVSDARKRTLGPFSPSFNVQGLLLEGLEKFLPEDAHLMVSGKLRISLTRVYDGKNVIVTDFNTKEELLEALLCSAFVPVFSGLIPPKFKGTRYMDGGFSDNLPTLDENTITVSPFCGESDICPRDLSSQLFHVNVANTSIELSRQNIYRIARILFPPKPETLSNMCKQGFDDALRFLHRNNLISCTSCLSVQSTIVVQDNIDDSCEYDPECTQCKHHRQEALVANLPDTVLTVFQDAIDTANKGLINWVFKHKGMKLLSILSLPYIIPIELVYATFNKLVSCGPWIGSNVQGASQVILDSLSNLLKRVDQQRQDISASIICQLAVTQYSDINLDLDGFHGARTKNQVINFTVDLDKGMVDPVTSLGNKILSRRSSLVLHKGDHDADIDTYDQILRVTSHHDAVMAYYYMDENNKVKVTEIFDVTSAESAAIFPSKGDPEGSITHAHRHKYDTWEPTIPSWTSAEKDNSISGLSDDSADYTFDVDNTGLFSDPESEWTPSISKQMESEPDMRPESDQSSTVTEVKPLSRKPSYVILT